ncbi:MAG: hypothetical protein HKO57_14065, partial [Akkermansiaceae bacterium]|nr:hypothetical protein [Akkermansiaceae bacterium]
TYTVTFSEPMDATTVDVGDFDNTAGTAPVTIDSVSATGDTAVFEVAVTPTGAGTIQLQIPAGSVLTDVAGNALDTAAAIADDTIITVDADNVAPTLAPADIVDDQFGGPVLEDQPVTYTLFFSEPMDAGTVDVGDFDNSSATAVTIDSVSATGDPSIFEVVVTPTEAGTLQLRVKAGAVLTDLPGNPLDTTTAIADDTVITVDADLVPTVISFEDDVSGGPIEVIDSVTYDVTFSEAMNAGTIDVGDFDNSSATGITIDSVSATGDPAIFVVVVTPTEPGTIQLQVAQGAVLEDLTGNPVDTTNPIPDDTIITVSADSTPPTLSSIVDNVSGGPVFEGQAVTYLVSFSEAMDDATIGASDFENASATAATIGSVTPTGDPAVFEVVATATEVGTLQLQIAMDAVLTDLEGNPLDTSSPLPDDTIINVVAGPDLVGELGVLDFTANGGINPNTGAEWAPGDQYRLAFHTDGTIDATSSDPAFYDAFATAQAAAAGLGGSWTAMVWVNTDESLPQGSSPVSSPVVRSGTDDQTGGAGVGGAGVPVYAMDGATCIARNNADIYNSWSNPFDGDAVVRIPAGTGAATQNVHYSPFLDQFGGGDTGNVHGANVWTGGFGSAVNPLGNSVDPDSQVRASWGSSNANNTGRVWNRFQSGVTSQLSVYAISDVLTVSSALPDPLVLNISESGGTLEFEWNSLPGMQYDLLSSTDPEAENDPSLWAPYNDGTMTYEDIPASGTSTTLTGVQKVGPVRFFTLTEEVIPPIFEADFEADNGGFTVSTTVGTDWEHGAPDSNGLGGAVSEGNGGSANCWATNLGDVSGTTADAGYYEDSTMTLLRSPVIDLTGIAAAKLCFAEALDLDSGDTAVVNIIDDVTDTVIAAAIYTATDGATGDADWATANGGVPIEIPPAALGQPVRIEWSFTGFGGTTDDYLGWYIDDVSVLQSTP